MRDILFKARQFKTKEWMEGNIVKLEVDDEDSPQYYIVDNSDWEEAFEGSCWEYNRVDPDTIGQFIGLQDKKKVNIFEGDSVVFRIKEEDVPITGKVAYNEEHASFLIEHPKGYHGYFGINWLAIDTAFEFEVIEQN